MKRLLTIVAMVVGLSSCVNVPGDWNTCTNRGLPWHACTSDGTLHGTFIYP